MLLYLKPKISLLRTINRSEKEDNDYKRRQTIEREGKNCRCSPKSPWWGANSEKQNRTNPRQDWCFWWRTWKWKRTTKTEDNFEDNFERVKKELYDMQQQQKEKPQKEVHKQRRTILLPKKRKETHSRKDSTAWNHSTTLENRNPSLKH